MSNPPTLWAQRSSETDEAKNVLLITIEVPELEQGYTVEFPNDEKLVFKGKSKSYLSAGHTEEAKEYTLDLELFDKVNGAEAKTSLTGKSLFICLPKKELKLEYWPRLTKDKKKLQFVKTDFSKWVDEDEQDGAEDDGPDPSDMGGMDMASMMGGGGMGGMGGLPNMGLGGGAGGLDMEALMKQMGGAGGMDMPDLGGEGDDGDDDDLPDLEDADAKQDADNMPSLEEAK